MFQYIPAIMSGVTGIAQAIKGAQGPGERPIYSTPQSVLDMINNRKRISNMDKMPGQDLIEAKIGDQTASSINDVKSYTGGGIDSLGALAKIYGGQQSQLRDLGIATAGWKDRQADKLDQALLTQAQFQDQEFNINQMQPYQDDAAASSALLEGGMSNIYNSVSDIAGGMSWGSMGKAGQGAIPTQAATLSQVNNQTVNNPMYPQGLSGGGVLGNFASMWGTPQQKFANSPFSQQWNFLGQ